MQNFRLARVASARLNLSKTLLQTICFWAGLLWLVPRGIYGVEERLGVPHFDDMRAVGVLILAVSSAGGLWSGFTMATVGRGTPFPLDTARELVMTGPYAWVRNPMAVTGLSQGFGVALLLGSWGAILYVLFGAALWQLFVRPLEEADLLARFGDAYADYRRRVGLWLPRMGSPPHQN